jgi:GNAT superfamily N-acetyltransferase
MIEGVSYSKLDLDRDVEAVTALHRADLGGRRPAEDTPIGWFRLGGPWMESSIAQIYFDEIIGAGALVIVARHHNQLVAFAEVEPLSGGIFFLSNIMVAVDVRRVGLGREMLKQVVTELRRIGGTRLITCPESGVEHFYESAGFTLENTRIQVEGTVESGKPERVWSEICELPGNLHLSIGGNQPEEHHRLNWRMAYQRLLGPSGPVSRLLRCSDTPGGVLVDLRGSKPGHDVATWLLVWGQVPPEDALPLALDAAKAAGIRRWFTFVSEGYADVVGLDRVGRESWWGVGL